MYGRRSNDVICKWCILEIINKMYCWVDIYINKDMAHTFTQERGSKGGLPMPIKPKPYFQIIFTMNLIFLFYYSKDQSLHIFKRVGVYIHLIELLGAWAWLQSTLGNVRVNMHGRDGNSYGKRRIVFTFKFWDNKRVTVEAWRKP